MTVDALRARQNRIRGLHDSSALRNAAPAPRNDNFAVSPVPAGLQDEPVIMTAAALIIGDEILNGKTLDRNSNVFAQYCFQHGIQLKRIEVIPDHEQEIIAASRLMVSEYDFVVTSGGIGPTHDDITYASLAKAFTQPLVPHRETQRRMDEMNKHRPWVSAQDPQQRAASQRMATFPRDAEVIFTDSNMWVPVVRLEKKLCVLPGIPTLFQKMLHGLTRYLHLPPSTMRPIRLQVFTQQSESTIAPYLASLQHRLKAHGIQIGSYPVFGQGVFVSLIGCESPLMQDVVKEVEQEVEGKIVTPEEARRKREEMRTKMPSSENIADGSAVYNFTCATEVSSDSSQGKV